ncbi:VCBS repeat-containing protein [Maribacter arenosus]|uniref:VCBS repeat-containing protein n=1 Tax=Maribacter arenosus TaxID=1854708 RepID=A0ABR7VD78_9FLAO|nr:VCBS repeat-containing protein [Maribacter arenosus]MBD0851591.1 VCBS repeat-containing protein [Maribacter arenosus]
MFKNNYPIILSILISILISSCTGKDAEHKDSIALFELLDSTETGVNFVNDLNYNHDFNVYKYRNFYNGGGVALGDINNDGLVDIYFSSNLKSNRLYLNKGGFKFEDITDKAKVGGTKAWSTGVTMADINADGYLDIYVCNSGDIAGDNKQNELFINNGPDDTGQVTFTEAAEKYGLDDQGFSTHASFFDYDKDGDLDVYLLNNSYRSIGSFNLQRNERFERDVLGGDKLLRNDGESFVDVSEEAGIYGSVIGFGLGVTVGDLNNDDWEDIYVSNDFFERDYIYINQKDGTFKETLTEQIQSLSGASMGADVADINNDGQIDLFVTEMLPSEYDRLKTVTTFEDWNKYQHNLKNGYYHQFTRNMLQLNNGNSTFSEIGRFSGVEASDWSWGALFFDMDNDGLKDLFIANGIYKDLTNQDYLQYVSSDAAIQSIVSGNQVDYDKLIAIIPSNKVRNHAYKNMGDLKFERNWNSGLDTPSFSNGSAYGDLDNDGDYDLVVNNVNMSSFVYRNNADSNLNHNYLKLVLHGQGKNTYAIGAKIKVETKEQSLYQEQQPIRGFQSSMDLRPNFGLSNNDSVNVQVLWPSGKITRIENVKANQTLELKEIDGVEFIKIPESAPPVQFTRSKLNIPFKHIENRFVDFDRDRLLPHMLSTEGPKISVADINNDGWEDLFIGGSKGHPSTLLLGKEEGFIESSIPDFQKNSNSEDGGSLFFDADNDGDQDLYVCSGGVEFSQFSSYLKDRLYFNDGQGNFSLSPQQLPSATGNHSTSTVLAEDIDGDGDLDLFVGERSVPTQYGMPGSGFILQNDGQGNFTDITAKVAPELQDLGMITDARFENLDADGKKELIVVGEFMGIEIFRNENGRFVKVTNAALADLKGWWRVVHPVDLDNDGDLDLVLGNHGENSRFRASVERPISLYVKDFDQNGFIDPIMTFTAENGKQYPYNLRHNLIEQLKDLKKKYPDFNSFKDAGIKDMFTETELEGAQKLQATTLSSMILINEGNLNFKPVKLPIEAQFTPIYAIGSGDFDQDGDMDLVMGGNLYNTKPEVGRYDASFGIYLENIDGSNFKYRNGGAGFSLLGEIRDIKISKQGLIVSRNNDSLAIFNYKSQ